MYEDEVIKRRIREHLASLPKFKHWCGICKKYLCTLPRQTELICFDCWNQYRVKPKQTGQSLLNQLIGEIQKSR